MLRRRSTGKRSLACAIEEHYKHPPPVNARRTVERLLRGIPPKHIEGLEAVILCDTQAFTENYGEDEKPSASRYIETKDQNPPWIEICVDKLIKGHKGLPLKIPFFRDMIFCKTLFHEIGHHIHNMQGSPKEDAEAVAEKWRKLLQNHYFHRKHCFIMIPLLIITSPLRRDLGKISDFLMSKAR